MVVVGLVPVIMFAFYQIIAWMSSANNYVLGSPVRVMSFDSLLHSAAFFSCQALRTDYREALWLRLAYDTCIDI